MSDNEEESETFTPDEFLTHAEKVFTDVPDELFKAFEHISNDLMVAGKIVEKLTTMSPLEVSLSKNALTDELNAINRSVLKTILHLEANVNLARDTARQVRSLLQQANEMPELPEGDPSAN